MRRSKSRVRAQVEMMEPRALLSALAPAGRVRREHPVVQVGNIVDFSGRLRIHRASVEIQNHTDYVLDVTAVLRSSPFLTTHRTDTAREKARRTEHQGV